MYIVMMGWNIGMKFFYFFSLVIDGLSVEVRLRAGISQIPIRPQYCIHHFIIPQAEEVRRGGLLIVSLGTQIAVFHNC